MNNVDFAMVGESHVSKKLDIMGFRYWWKPFQRNFYGADFITEYGIIDVKIANAQTKKYISRKTKTKTFKRYWKFNCHHHGTRQKDIDVFVFIIVDFNKHIYFIIPKEMVRGKTFVISERQIENGRYNYFIDNWKVLSSMKDRCFSDKKVPTWAELAKKLKMPYSRLYRILTGINCAEKFEILRIEKLLKNTPLSMPKAIRAKVRATSMLNWKLHRVYKKKGFTIKSISKKTGISMNRFFRILHGHAMPTQEERQKIARFLRCPQKEIF